MSSIRTPNVTGTPAGLVRMSLYHKASRNTEHSSGYADSSSPNPLISATSRAAEWLATRFASRREPRSRSTNRAPSSGWYPERTSAGA